MTKTAEFHGIVLSGKAAPEGERVIEDLEQLKVTYDPLRSKIMRALAHEHLSIKELALRVGTSPARLYHHMGVLEDNGFVEVAETRTAGKNIERVYGLTATRFRFAPELIGVDHPGESELAVAELYETARDLAQAFRDKEEGVFGKPGADYDGLQLKLRSRVPYKRAVEFMGRLQGLAKEYFGKEDVGQVYTFFAVVTPTEPE